VASVPEPMFNIKIGRLFSIQTAHSLLVSGSRPWINVSKAVTVTQDPVPHMPPTVYLGWESVLKPSRGYDRNITHPKIITSSVPEEKPYWSDKRGASCSNRHRLLLLCISFTLKYVLTEYSCFIPALFPTGIRWSDHKWSAKNRW